MKKYIFIVVLLLTILIAVSVHYYLNIQKSSMVNNINTIVENTSNSNIPQINDEKIMSRDSQASWLKDAEKLQSKDFRFLENLSKNKKDFDARYDNGSYYKLGTDNKRRLDIVLFTAWPLNEISTHKPIQFIFLKNASEIILLTNIFPKVSLVFSGEDEIILGGAFKINTSSNKVTIDNSITYTKLEFPKTVPLKDGTILKRGNYLLQNPIQHNTKRLKNINLVANIVVVRSIYSTENPTVRAITSVGIYGPANTFLSYSGDTMPDFNMRPELLDPLQDEIKNPDRDNLSHYINARARCHGGFERMFANPEYVNSTQLKSVGNINKERYTFINPDNKIVASFYDFAKKYGQDNTVKMYSQDGGLIEIKNKKEWVDRGGIFLQKDVFGMYVVNVNIFPFMGGC